MPKLEADSAFFWPPKGIPPDLAAEWDRYPAAWEGFLDRNPRVRLAWIVGWVSETHYFCSWPTGWEDVIRDWVRAGMPDPRPFDDRIGIDTSEWRQRLREAADETGDGWVYYDDVLVWR